jgi:solute carrier family 35 protein E1
MVERRRRRKRAAAAAATIVLFLASAGVLEAFAPTPALSGGALNRKIGSIVSTTSSGFRCRRSRPSSALFSTGAASASASPGPDAVVQQPAAAAAISSGALAAPQATSRLKVGLFFIALYFCNVNYCLSTKLCLNHLKIPWSLAAVQLVAGLPYVWFLWATKIRRAPSVTMSQLRSIIPVALAHTAAHVAAVVSLGAGAVGFVQVVKAAEPMFTAALSALVLNQWLPSPVYATLLPVIGGVAIASANELTFSPLALAAAMTSNFCAGLRSVLGKSKLGDGIHTDAGNLYAMMTMMGSALLVPLAWAIEGSTLSGQWKAAVAAGQPPLRLAQYIASSGIFFYLYNEVAFYILNMVHPVTHAIGNTIKRVVMIFVSVLVLHHRFTVMGAVGSATCLGGVMLYGIVKGKLEKKSRRESIGVICEKIEE